MNIRKQDMYEWRCNTRRYGHLAEALDAAEYSHLNIGGVSVLIWPLGNQWLVITQVPTTAN
jgi:hypothetical protein